MASYWSWLAYNSAHSSCVAARKPFTPWRTTWQLAPTGDLDRKSGDEVLTLLERLNKEFKKTIVMVTHDPHAAERAHIVRHLDKGELQ